MKYLIANWKMYLSQEESLFLARSYVENFKKEKAAQVIVAPNTLFLSQVSEVFRQSKIKLAGQNISVEAKGAFTGDICASDLKAQGADYCLVGHSERRLKAGETNTQIHEKINLCYQNNLVPILCLGETKAELASGGRESVLNEQLKSALQKVPNLDKKELFIAYEPVWAIGASSPMPPPEMLSIIRILKRNISAMTSEKFFNEKVKILYGGAISSQTAREFWALDGLHGLLVGRDSLQADSFWQIAQASC